MQNSQLLIWEILTEINVLRPASIPDLLLDINLKKKFIPSINLGTMPQAFVGLRSKPNFFLCKNKISRVSSGNWSFSNLSHISYINIRNEKKKIHKASNYGTIVALRYTSSLCARH